MDASGYLRYLPPVLWQDRPGDQAALLCSATLLRIFEKVLTGIDDGRAPRGPRAPSITDRSPP